jgi:hypothetical protein
MMNLEIYEKDPRTHTLLNQGVAKVTSGQTSAELETLRYELTNFVCDGQYAEGLSRILSTYLGHLDKPEQPGVWVSGFFGSGKSHLVKMLQYLWTDFEFTDGAKARGLPKKLPTGLKDLLKELSTAAKRLGGLHAAAGTLGAGAGESIRLELLGIIFKSVGLPEQFSRASFMIWLRDEGLEDDVRQFVKNAGGDFDKELANLYVSDLIAKAILDARPDFANKPAEVKTSLQKQFPKVSDVSIDEMIVKIKQAVGKKDKLPCTIIILDEVQQYIADDVNRSKAVQDLQEQCCSRLGSSVMFVATGQNALSGMPLLQRLQGRFPVTVELQDTDVEQVTREVVLKKKPTAEAGLKKLLDDHSGEIERQLASTKIAFSSRDRSLLVQDYPILPVRRRFWERVLRAVDKAGTGAQLRTQLWIVYDAVKNTAEFPLGTVVNGAFLYEHIKTRVLQSGILLQEIAETIARQKQEDDGDMRYQLCSLIFLIGQLPHQGPADAGVRADADTLADLLVTDLTTSSAELRKKVPVLLEALVASGAIMQVENEYRMQTREGSEWNQMFLESRNKLLNDPGKLASERSQLLRSQCSEVLKKFKLLHGDSKEARKIDLHFGDTAPSTDGSAIPVWVRDGWEVELNTVLTDARSAGDTAAIVYGYIPKKMAEDLKQAIAGYYAATTTLQAKGTPSGDEGIHARKAMETRQEQSQRSRDNLITDILNEMQVYLAGGDNIAGTLLNQKVQDAATLCLDRLYPLFHLADYPASDWEKVYTRAKGGAADALIAVGHKEDADQHPVCKAVIDYVGSGKKGADVQKHFDAPKYGWPKDAINAALVVLVHAGVVRAISSSKESIPPAKLDQKTISAVEFRCETIKLTNVQLTELRGLFKKVGLLTQPNQESPHAVDFLNRLTKLAESAGGDSPLPKCPDISHITDMANRVGNEQLKAIHENKDQLLQQIAEWKGNHELIEQRLPRWKQTAALLKFAADLPVAADVQPEVTAIELHRTLLANPDPVPGMVEQLTNALRTALNETQSKFSADYDARLTTLTQSPTWNQIAQPQRHEILGANGIRVLPTIAVGTTEEVLDTLRHTKLSELLAFSDALPTRFNNAATAAAKLLEPKAQHVSLPGGTIKSEDDLKLWLAEAETCIRKKLKDGPVIL